MGDFAKSAKALYGLAAALAAGAAYAGDYSFMPDPKDMDGFDHHYYYSWGIQWNVPSGEQITEAKLIIKNIWDWTEEDDDQLFVHLLDDPQPGVHSGFDDQGGGDYFNNQGPLIGVYSDPVGGHSRNYDLVYNLKDLGLIPTVNAYASNGVFGFGFDPDCHYFNDGVELQVHTEPVPEPASLIGLGIAGLAMLRRKRKH
jgi:hypothetical protein